MNSSTSDYDCLEFIFNLPQYTSLVYIFTYYLIRTCIIEVKNMVLLAALLKVLKQRNFSKSGMCLA